MLTTKIKLQKCSHVIGRENYHHIGLALKRSEKLDQKREDYTQS